MIIGIVVVPRLAPAAAQHYFSVVGKREAHATSSRTKSLSLR